jgi:hypothetical protein
VASTLDRESPPASAEPEEIVFIDDELPAGVQVSAPAPHGWPWTDDRPFSGTRAHGLSGAADDEAQHYVLGASEPIDIGPSDTLFVHVRIDPADPPREIMVQWNDGGGNDGGWSHRAYWGEDLIQFGVADSPSRRPMGPLPRAGDVGGWIRLEVPARAVGFGAGSRLSGMSFDQAGGTVLWDRSGVLSVPEPPASAPLADLMWVLFTSPEFQYIR